MKSHRIATIVGSLRRDSVNRKVAHAIAAAAPDGLDFQFVEIGDLPLYNSDLDGDPPAAWTRFREEVAACDGILFATPEYNRSMPGVLKNAVDIGSRPYGHSVFAKKPAAIVTASPGTYGGFGSNHHLRQSCVFLDMPVMQQPEGSLAKVGDDSFAADGSPADPRLAKAIATVATAFADWVGLIHAGRAALANDEAGSA